MLIGERNCFTRKWQHLILYPLYEKRDSLIRQARSTQTLIMGTVLLEFSFMVYLNVLQYCSVPFSLTNGGLINLARTFELWTSKQFNF